MSMAWGPYETETQAVADSGGMRDETVRLRRLLQVCRDCGVDLQDLDRRTLSWLARWEPQTVQVVAGWISRAHAAGQTTVAGPGEDAEEMDLISAVLAGKERLLTPGETAAMMRVDEKTLTRWAAAGLIGCVWTGGRHRRYPESAVRAVLAGEAANDGGDQ